jgi:predicted RNA-binding Zn-ribbon protein involved in translation (DUF1610 family)
LKQAALTAEQGTIERIVERLIYILSAGIVVVAALFFLFFYVKKLQKLSTGYRSYDEIDRYVTYKCPRCGKVMENGFSTASKGISYRANDEKPLSPFQFELSRLLKNTMNITTSAKENVAWRCEDCNYILVNHSYLVGKKRTT